MVQEQGHVTPNPGMKLRGDITAWFTQGKWGNCSTFTVIGYDNGGFQKAGVVKRDYLVWSSESNEHGIYDYQRHGQEIT